MRSLTNLHPLTTADSLRPSPSAEIGIRGRQVLDSNGDSKRPNIGASDGELRISVRRQTRARTQPD